MHDSSDVDWRSHGLPDLPVVGTPPFARLSLHLTSLSQLAYSSNPENFRGRHIPQGLVIAPVVVVADEGYDSRL